ncbi:MAG: DUF6436 domain-containing protein [Pseudomonadota bacterium]
MPRLSRKTLFASLLALVWLLGMLAALWWYQMRYIRAFDEQVAQFSGAELRLPADLAGPGPIRLVHFWDPACPCNVGNQQHLAELIERFGPQGVSFYAVQKSGSKGQLPAPLGAMQPLVLDAERLPASPAVAIWGRDGQLAYFGPYSAGLTCTSSNSFIEPILEALQKGRKVEAGNTLAVGCFCPWREAVSD